MSDTNDLTVEYEVVITENATPLIQWTVRDHYQGFSRGLARGTNRFATDAKTEATQWIKRYTRLQAEVKKLNDEVNVGGGE